jgi:hypothetical protein
LYVIFLYNKSNTGDNETTTNIEKEKDFYVSIEFLSWPIIRYKKEVLFGFVDLLVSFGGIAGLFLGFSLLSGIEIIYYFSMRACCMFVENRVRKSPNKILPFLDIFLHTILFVFLGRTL